MSKTISPLEVASFNQSPAFADVDLFSLDQPLVDAVARAGLDPAPFSAFGRAWGTAEVMAEAEAANTVTPRLKTVDPKGNRLDRVEFHPAYHAFMKRSIEAGIHCSAFDGNAADAAAPAVARAVRQYMAVGIEAGHMCPVTMTNAALPALAAAPGLLAKLAPKIKARTYDPAPKPWFQKAGITIGMGMTERQGGTDVRANSTIAIPTGDHVRITGHKWFMSAPMCDAFLVLAQGEAGLSCYFVPRHEPNGSLNGLHFIRLKDKLGNRSNASSEVEFIDAYGTLVGKPGAGVKTIIEMVQWTRLDCAVSSAGLMRMGLAQAIHHTRHRTVFQRRLSDQPAMRAVIADMALDMEGHVALVMRLARAFDLQKTDQAEAAYARLMTPAIKYHVCKRAPAFLYEAMECQGGNGYVEELPLARLYREAPLNAIWEGSGNVMALDILRAAQRHPDATRATVAALAKSASAVIDVRPTVEAISAALTSPAAEARARYIAETLAKLATVAALAEAESPFARNYAASRLQAAHDHFGAVDISNRDAEALTARALTQ